MPYNIAYVIWTFRGLAKQCCANESKHDLRLLLPSTWWSRKSHLPAVYGEHPDQPSCKMAAWYQIRVPTVLNLDL